jgi:hypothetical protein
VAAVHLHPGWRAAPGPSPNDIALIELREAVPSRRRAMPYRSDDEAGKEIVLVGAGDSGTGLSGPSEGDGRLRAGSNRIDAVRDGEIVFDFDAPDAEDATDLEGVSGPGDSGGPALFVAGDSLFVVGVSVAQDGQGRGPGRYGAVEFYTRVSRYSAWIDEMSGAAAR